MECYVCGNDDKEDLTKCTNCKEITCVNCLVLPQPYPHVMIDFDLCDDCLGSYE